MSDMAIYRQLSPRETVYQIRSESTTSAPYGSPESEAEQEEQGCSSRSGCIDVRARHVGSNNTPLQSSQCSDSWDQERIRCETPQSRQEKEHNPSRNPAKYW
jgi:hypothetical protein